MAEVVAAWGYCSDCRIMRHFDEARKGRRWFAIHVKRNLEHRVNMITDELEVMAHPDPKARQSVIEF